MTPLEAQSALEEGLAKAQGFDEAVAWLDAHPEVADKINPLGLLADFLRKT